MFILKDNAWPHQQLIAGNQRMARQRPPSPGAAGACGAALVALLRETLMWPTLPRQPMTRRPATV